MLEYRSASQILFGHLPEQTVDLGGRIWKVSRWRRPDPVPLELDQLRRALVRQAGAWEAAQNDAGYVGQIRSGRALAVLMLNRQAGVEVAPFPRVFKCKRCDRVSDSASAPCKCGARGARTWGQLPFVHYHSCGAIRNPYVPRCRTHDDVRVRLPGTASVSEILFECPACRKVLRRGFGLPTCECGGGPMQINVHRASSVYTPLSVVVVNPPSRMKARQIEEAGGSTRALDWVLGGLATATLEEVGTSPSAVLQTLLAQGLSRDAAEAIVAQAVASGQLKEEQDGPRLGLSQFDDARADAVTIALALSESRTRVQDLQAGTDDSSELGVYYREKYPRRIAEAGLEAVELVDRFPILTGSFAYTRGGGGPGETTLVPFRRERSNELAVYADLAQTEALFFRLDPCAVVEWLRARGHALDSTDDGRLARLEIIDRARVPAPGDPAREDIGSEILALVHSYSHRMMRTLAVLAGIDRNGLSELLVPLHLGFFVYAAARGDFVLGGLQAVFEGELHNVLREFVGGDHRCPLDPGCSKGGAACAACLHVGEPSCRYFNRFLDRRILFGDSGYLDNLSPP